MEHSQFDEVSQRFCLFSWDGACCVTADEMQKSTTVPIHRPGALPPPPPDPASTQLRRSHIHTKMQSRIAKAMKGKISSTHRAAVVMPRAFAVPIPLPLTPTRPATRIFPPEWIISNQHHITSSQPSALNHPGRPCHRWINIVDCSWRQTPSLPPQWCRLSMCEQSKFSRSPRPTGRYLNSRHKGPI